MPFGLSLPETCQGLDRLGSGAQSKNEAFMNGRAIAGLAALQKRSSEGA